MTEPGIGSPMRQAWLVAALTLVSMLAMIDKNVITLLVPHIKRDLGITDTQVGLVIGVAFALTNVLVAIPAGWLADRGPRRLIVSAGVTTWSVMAAACGFASSFWSLFVARAGVGLAEGLIPPACYSLLRDGVTPGWRGRAFSVYAMSALVGTGLAFVLGGLIVGWLTSQPALPFIGHLPIWSQTLVLVGVSGGLFILLPWTVRPPARAAAAGEASWRETWRRVVRDAPVYRPLAAFGVAHAMLTNSMGVWVPTLLALRFDMGPQTAGPVLGLLLIVMGPIGLFAAGWIMDRLDAAGRSGPAVVALGVALLVAIPGVLEPIAPNAAVTLALQAALVLGATTYLAVTSTLVARLASPLTVGKTMAIFLVLHGVVGAGLAPVVTAVTAAHLFADNANSLGLALTTVNVAYSLVAIGSAWLLLSALRRRPLSAGVGDAVTGVTRAAIEVDRTREAGKRPQGGGPVPIRRP